MGIMIVKGGAIARRGGTLSLFPPALFKNREREIERWESILGVRVGTTIFGMRGSGMLAALGQSIKP